MLLAKFTHGIFFVAVCSQVVNGMPHAILQVLAANFFQKNLG